MKTKLLYCFSFVFLNVGLMLPALAQEATENNFERLIKSAPMVVVLFFKDNPGNLEEAFLQASRTPRYRFSEIQFVKAETSQPEIKQALAKYGIEERDLPIIVLFRDGQIVSDENANLLGLAHEATAEELRDFIDDYFSDLIEGVIKYSQENPSQFSAMPSEEILKSDFSPDFISAVSYQPIIFNHYTTWVQPPWWRSFYQSTFFHRYWPGFRPTFGPRSWPRWFRPGRPERRRPWRVQRDPNRGGRPDEKPLPPQRPSRPGRPGEGGEGVTRPTRPSRPGQDEEVVTRPARPGRPGEGGEGVTRPTRPSRPGQDEEVVTRPARPGRPGEGREEVTRPRRPSRPERAKEETTRLEGRGRFNRQERGRDDTDAESRDRSGREERRR